LQGYEVEMLQDWFHKWYRKWQEPSFGREMHSSCSPPKLALDAQTGNASSLETIKQFRISQNYCNQMQEERNQFLLSLHFCANIFQISSFFLHLNLSQDDKEKNDK
jgi:hypothetical protein